MSATVGFIGQGREVVVQRFVQQICIAFLAFLFTPLAHAQEHRTFTVPFRSVNGLILLDGQINGVSAAFLLDTGANNSIVDVRSAGFDGLKLDPLQSTGKAGAEGGCARREVKLSLEHRSWLNRRVCVMDLADVSRRMGVRVDGFIGSDVLSEFAAVRIDYKAALVEFEQ